MARPTLPTESKKRKRVNLSLTDELKENLSALAAIDEKTPTELAGEIIKRYVSTRQDEVDAYRDSLKNIRNQFSA